MLTRMTSRSLALGLGVIAMFGLAACGSDGGTGASTASTTVNLSAPVYVTAPTVAPTTTLVGGAVVDPNAPAAVDGEQAYTVVSGDYALGIAKKHCISLDTLIAYNAWTEGSAHPLNPGDVVKIPSGGCSPSAATTVPAAPGEVATTPAPAAETTTTVDLSAGATYTVVAGDYLGANGWTDGANHLIYAGLKIKLPTKTG
jgi:LysM repeat protein